MNHFAYGANTFYFNCNPDTGASEQYVFYQVEGRDTLGQRYCYQKSNIYRKIHSLAYSFQSDSEKASFITFVKSVIQGNAVAFTWYDHLNVAHTVYITNGTQILTELVDQNTISFELEEEVTFTLPLFISCRNDKEAHPIWFVKTTINGSTIYISDGTYSITPLGITTIPLIESWGSIESSLNNLNDMNISDFVLDIISTTQGGLTSFIEYATTYELEKESCELYLWFAGQDSLEPIKFKGYIRDVDIPNDTKVSLTIEDTSSRLKTEIGTKVSLDDYPECDPDDVGKVIPIIYNTVEKVPALAVDAGQQTTLAAPNGIIDTTVSFLLSEMPSTWVVGTKFWIDQEKMTITSISGCTVGVTRAVDSTTAQNHSKAAVVWEDKTSFVYLAADHGLDNINKVFATVGQGKLDITSICTRYLGITGSQLTGYEGKAAISIPGYVTAAQAVSLGFLDAGSVVGSISLQSLIALLDPGHTHNSAISTNQNTLTALPTNINSWSGSYYYTTLSFPTDVTGRTQVSYSVTIKKLATVSNGDLHFRINSTDYWFVDNYWLSVPVGESRTITFTTTVAGDCNANSLLIYHYDYVDCYQITAASRTIQTSSNTSSSNASGNTITAGDIELSGNSVANTLVGDSVLFNATRVITEEQIMTDIITRCGETMPVWVSGTINSSCQINGVINEYKQGIYWLNKFAFQLLSWFYVEHGTAHLVPKPTTLTSVRTIAACCADSSGVSSLLQKKMELDNVLNTINVLYKPDYTKSGDTRYQANVKTNDATYATSIANYGIRQKPDWFQCDFVITEAHAIAIRDYYGTYYSTRKWLYTFDTFLDYSDIPFGTVVTLGFAGNKVGVVIGVYPIIGSKDQIDKMKFTVLV